MNAPVDFAIVTALEEERDAVLDKLPDHRKVPPGPDDVRVYYTADLPVTFADGQPSSYRVVVVPLLNMGRVEAANAAGDAIRRWQPRYVLLVGIAGGIGEAGAGLGDILVSDQVVDYELQKLTPEGASFRYVVHRADPALLGAAQNHSDPHWLDLIELRRPGKGLPRRLVGPIATGDKVVAAREALDRLRAAWPKLLGVEMEAGGVASAAFQSVVNPGFFMVRCVSDLADKQKDSAAVGKWRRYACHAAAAYAIGLLHSGPVPPAPEAAADVPRASPSRLPRTGAQFLGRKAELRRLDDAWKSGGKTRIVSVVAAGGVGKTTLVKRWRDALSRKDYKGAGLVFEWSFYNQGTNNEAATSQEFLNAGLRLFGQDAPTRSLPPWERAARLAELFRRRRTLLILDGLEPLQFPPGENGGALRDTAMAALLRGLAEPNRGLCVLTSRQPVAELADHAAVARTIELGGLSDEEGARLLEDLGVEGSDAERMKASAEFSGHPLALMLLGKYLHAAFPDHHVQHRGEVDLLAAGEGEAGHAGRVMRSYARWLGEGSREVAALRLLGLFDRPADPDCLAALRSDPVIPGLTEAVTGLSEEDWNRALSRLEELGLVSFTVPPAAGLRLRHVDAHPLVRAHFGAELRSQRPDAWQAGHDRLYEYLKGSVPFLPEEYDEVMTLFQATAHGCAAGRYQDAFQGVYVRRALQLNPPDEYRYFSTDALGAYAPGLAALSGFYARRWTEPVAGLAPGDRALVLHETAVHLLGVGRLAESLKPFERAVGLFEAEMMWEWASVPARYLGELHTVLGELKRALGWARKSVGFSRQAGDPFELMANQTSLADTLHQAGQFREAGELFREAEQITDKNGQAIRNVFFFWGFGHGELLLTLGRADEVLARARQALERIDQIRGSLLAAAQIHLSLGRALLAQAQDRQTDPTPAAEHLDKAVATLERAAHQVHLPRGLLARADLRRASGDYKACRADLDRALGVAERDPQARMVLHAADCHLGYCRLHLARRRKTDARRSLQTASDLIRSAGYRRRDQEVEQLGKMVE